MASVHARHLDPKVGSVLASLGKALLEAIEVADFGRSRQGARESYLQYRPMNFDLEIM